MSSIQQSSDTVQEDLPHPPILSIAFYVIMINMLRIAAFNHFDVVQSTNRGWYIEGEGEKLFVPKKELSPKIQVGHRVKLFVYNKGNDTIRATSAPPYGILNEFAYLKVKEVAKFGVFLEWGIPKDLFVPRRNLKNEPKTGDYIIVRIIPDGESRQVVGTALIDDYLLEKPGKELKVNQQAKLMICGIKDIGMKVIVNNKYRGMLYKDEVTDKIRYGQTLQGYIKKIRPDGLIDVTLKK